MFPFITVSNTYALHTSHCSRFIDLLRAERTGDRFPERGQEIFTLSETLDPLWYPHALILNAYCDFFHFGYIGRHVMLAILLPVDPR